MTMYTQPLGKVAPTYEGVWDASRAYGRLCVVTHAGSAYVSVAEVAADTEPPADGWQLLARGVGYSDLTPEQVEGLMRPAKEAAAEVRAAEELRAEAERGRASAEAARARSEAAREAAEGKRADAERSRATAEAARSGAEEAREAAEAARGKAEQAREAAEAVRSGAESSRASAETARAKAEQAREAAEGKRSDAEVARDAAEAARELAETDRASDFAGIRDAAEAATTRAAAAATKAADAADSASSAAKAALGVVDASPRWDEALGRYADESITATLARMGRGLVYGVEVPKGLATVCTKVGANAGVANPVPGVVGTPAVDPYAALGGPFATMEVNGVVDEDGSPHVTAIRGDGRFRRDGSNGDVWVCAPVLWWDYADEADRKVLRVCERWQPGLRLQPKALLPSGGQRPFMLYARYGGSIGDDGRMHSWSGRRVATRVVSHDSLIAQTACATTGYSGKSYVDDWYVKVMFLLKYATKNSQSAFLGCTAYSGGYAPALAEAGTHRVVLAKAQAANLVVGSNMMLGTGNGDGTAIDRNAAKAYDVFDARAITAIEAVDDATSAVTFGGEAFDVATTMWLQTAPWDTGATDDVEGDGSPTSNRSGKEPFQLQGIELSYGAYEALGDALLLSEGKGWQVVVNPDTRGERANAVADGAERTGKYVKAGDAPGYDFAPYPDDAGGLLFGTGGGASSSTGTCDVTYYDRSTATGVRQWRGLGYLGDWSNAGLWFLDGTSWSGGSGWYTASRLSGSGRSKGVSAT